MVKVPVGVSWPGAPLDTVDTPIKVVPRQTKARWAPRLTRMVTGPSEASSPIQR